MKRKITVTYKNGEKEENYSFKDIVISEGGIEINYTTEKKPPHKGYIILSKIKEITIK